MTLDYLPDVDEQKGIYYALGCNGRGVNMTTYLGHKVAYCILECRPASDSAYGERPLPTHPLYNGDPWFLPAVGTWYQMRDVLGQRLAVARHGQPERGA